MPPLYPPASNIDDLRRLIAKLKDYVDTGQLPQHGVFYHLWPVYYTGTPGTQEFGDSPAEGTAELLARSDHKHGMPQLGQDKTTWNGIATTWTLTNIPKPQLVWLFSDGALLNPQVDYTLSSNVITIINGPLNDGSKSVCLYFY